MDIPTETCVKCDRSRLVSNRPYRADDGPQIHYGNIASGDQVVKDGPTRGRHTVLRDGGGGPGGHVPMRSDPGGVRLRGLA
jgi:hypothetical protein